VVEWLAPIALFWTMASMYLGGFQIRIEGGSGLQQIIGLIITFALYLGAYTLLHMALRGVVGTVFSVIFACLIASLLMPILARIGFRLVGVRISKAAAAHH
jgi:hypothetical protein